MTPLPVAFAPIRLPSIRLPVAPVWKNTDAVRVIPRDEIPGARDRAADDIVRRTGDGDAVRLIGNRRGPCQVGADVVALDDVAGGQHAADQHALERIAGNDVAIRGRRPADRIPRRIGDVEQQRQRFAIAAVPPAFVPMRFPVSLLLVVVI